MTGYMFILFSEENIKMSCIKRVKILFCKMALSSCFSAIPCCGFFMKKDVTNNKEKRKQEREEKLRKAKEENNVRMYNLERIFEYLDGVTLRSQLYEQQCGNKEKASVPPLFFPDFETLCRLVEEYANKQSMPMGEESSLQLPAVTEQEQESLQLSQETQEEKEEKQSTLQSLPSFDKSSESSEGAGFIHDFDKYMRRYSM
jgi:hypothetical protein